MNFASSLLSSLLGPGEVVGGGGLRDVDMVNLSYMIIVTNTHTGKIDKKC